MQHGLIRWTAVRMASAIVRPSENVPSGVLLGGGILALLLATVPGHLYSVDGLAYYRTATQLAWHGSLLFDPPFTWGSSTPAPVWPVGYSLALVPAALVAWPLRHLQPAFDPSQPYERALLYGDPIYLLTMWVNPLIVAGTALCASALASRVGVGPRMAMVVGLVTAVGSPLLFYARADFAQPLATLLLVSSVLVALRVRDGDVRALWLAPICGWAILVRPVDGAFATVMALTILVVPGSGCSPTDRVRRLAVVAGGAAVGVGVALAVNFVRRGHPIEFGQGAYWSGDPLDGLLAYLVSPGRGLPWHFPLIVAAPHGFVALLRSSRKVEALAIALPIALFLGVYPFATSLGDWSYGPRHMVPLLPFAAILAGVAWRAASGRATRLGFTALALTGVLANAALILVDQLPWWGIRGGNVVDTPGFWAQFELGAYAPIGSLTLYKPASLSQAADIFWLWAMPSTGGVSAVIPVLLVASGAMALWLAWGRVGGAGATSRTDPTA